MTLSDDVCDEIIKKLRAYKLPGFELISRGLLRRVIAESMHFTDKPTSRYSLFLLREYFRDHPPDLVTLLGDVVRDES